MPSKPAPAFVPLDPPERSRALLQEKRWFSARCDALETLLKSIIQELELSIPKAEIKGAYAPGDDYEFYRDLKSIVEKGTKSLFVIDNYLDVQLFDLYMERVSPSVDIRILTDQLRGAVQTVVQKFVKRGQFELRTSRDAHDRHVFVDNRGWVIGQSIKDAAVKKPTYIIELGNPSALRAVYEQIWSAATPVVKS
jgi:hypothetical protein